MNLFRLERRLRALEPYVPPRRAILALALTGCVGMAGWALWRGWRHGW